VRLWPLKGSTTSLREAWRKLAGTDQPPLRTALSLGLGLAIGVLPIMPLQTGVALGAAFLFRLNRVTTFLGTLIWQPFTAPLIVAAELWIGRLLLPAAAEAAGTPWERWGWPLVVGSGVLAVCWGGLGTAAAYLALSARSRQRSAPSVSKGGGE
jgi:uncharacterized protein (DUF2062 family)